MSILYRSLIITGSRCWSAWLIYTAANSVRDILDDLILCVGVGGDGCQWWHRAMRSSLGDVCHVWVTDELILLTRTGGKIKTDIERVIHKKTKGQKYTDEPRLLLITCWRKARHAQRAGLMHSRELSSDSWVRQNLFSKMWRSAVGCRNHETRSFLLPPAESNTFPS